ncbi:hypothetical protein Hanom_Chr16g01495811 [Helianthus anomalus]
MLGMLKQLLTFLQVFLFNFLQQLLQVFLFRVNFRFAPCGLVTLTVLLQTFKNSHFAP